MIRLDNFPGSRQGKAFRDLKRRPKDYFGEIRCVECGRQAIKHRPTQILCGRIACYKKRSNRLYNARKRERRIRRRPDGNLLPAQPNLHCDCGELLKFGSNPMTGTTTEYCTRCGVRPVQLYGKRIYDQRERLEAELQGFVERAQEEVSREVSPNAGNAWRQQTHRAGAKGIVACLKSDHEAA